MDRFALRQLPLNAAWKQLRVWSLAAALFSVPKRLQWFRLESVTTEERQSL